MEFLQHILSNGLEIIAECNDDAHSAAVVHRILRKLVDSGGTVLLTTHNMDEVQEICDRVAILCRGKLIALDTPLALRQQHEDRKADAVLQDGRRRTFDLDRPGERDELAALVSANEIASVQTREFDFHAAFLKLTGTQFE